MRSGVKIKRKPGRLCLTAVLLLGLGLGMRPAFALDVHAIYLTACQRELGVILRVDKRQVFLLRHDGSIKQIPRHEIVSLVYYPVAQFTLARMPSAPAVLPIRIHTRDQRQTVELAFGWPINYSEKKLSLLLPSGDDFSVDKNSIWSLDFAPLLTTTMVNPPARAVTFEHPQTSGFCTSARSSPGARRVFPQQILNDRVVIRRELDRLMDGYDELLDDIGDQKFYPVPQIYRDRTSLGYWGSIGSRYGASSSRSNTLTPLLQNTLSLGPFRYQHLFFTGSTPNGLLIHNEAQTQIFYRFKAAYFHTSLLVDPNLALVGEKYWWRAEDLQDETLDDRLNEYAVVELGFDFGPVAIQLQPVSMAQGAVKFGPVFDSEEAIVLWRGGLRVTLPDWQIEAMGGYSAPLKETYYDDSVNSFYGNAAWQYAYARFNLGWHLPWYGWSVRLWSVIRHLSYDLTLNSQSSGARSDRHYESLVVSSALQAIFPFWHRYEVGGHFILEVQRRHEDDQPADTRLRPKLALFAGMSF